MLTDVVILIYNRANECPWVALALVGLALALYQLCIYPFYLSPLRDIPGPYLYRITGWMAYLDQQQARFTKKVHKLHQKYGDVVIISPTAISCNGDPKYIHDIYVKNMPKAKFYENFRNHGFKDNIFALLENDRHLKYKKIVQSLYLKSSVFNPTNTSRRNVVEKVNQLVEQVYLSSVSGKNPDWINAKLEMNEHGKGHRLGSSSWFQPHLKSTGIGIEVYSLFGSLAMDVVSSFELGSQNGTRLLKEPESRSILVSHRMVAGMVFWTTLMPRLWDWAAGPMTRKAARVIEEWQLGLYKHAEENVPKLAEGQNPSTLEAFKKHGYRGDYAYSFLTDNIFAGHETTAIQLSYMCYELSRPCNKHIQDKFRKELREAFGTPGELTQGIEDFEVVDKLPFLEALMQENSRVHTSIPGYEPRVTDLEYQVAVGKKKIKLPLGTEISVQPYLMHRVESVFPHPEVWNPGRWMQRTGETEGEYKLRVKNMQKYMMPFGKGVRMCLGMNLALIEMKLALSNLYWRFELQICSDWCNIAPAEKLSPIKMGKEYASTDSDEGMMVMYDAYTTRPFFDECWLGWTEA